MQITIEKLVYGGDGLARTEQGVIFVPRTAPGDVAEIHLTQRKKDYASGHVDRLIVPSPDRQTPFCPNYETAGCCHWQHIRYDRQLEYKKAILRESLSRIAKIQFETEIRTINGPDRNYRLRADFHVYGQRLGFMREHSHFVVPIQECASLSPELNQFITHANAVIASERFRDLTEVAVINGSTIAATFMFGKNEPDFPWERMRDELFTIPRLSSVRFVSAKRKARYQKAQPEIEVLGNRFGLDSYSFFQANRFLLEPFMEEVIGQCGRMPGRVLDLYCGSGFFSIPLAKISTELIGVESSRRALKQASENAAVNHIRNAEFAEGDVETCLTNATLKPDLIVVNPPRTGAGIEASKRIAELRAPRLVYISCNPTTFAREAAQFIKNGYALRRLSMIDQFPHTYHIESVAQFELE